MVTGTKAVKGKISWAEFVRKAIVALRKGEYKGIHSVYSGFQDAACKYFGVPKQTVWAELDKLAESDTINTHRAKGGVMIYLPGEAPIREDNKGEKALASMGIS